MLVDIFVLHFPVLLSQLFSLALQSCALMSSYMHQVALALGARKFFRLADYYML